MIHRLSPEVLVPPAVFDEVVVVGAGLLGAAELGAAVWIQVVTPTRNDLVTAFLGAVSTSARRKPPLRRRPRGQPASQISYV